MGNKISRSDENVVIGVANISLPDKKHLDINSNNNNIEVASSPETEASETPTINTVDDELNDEELNKKENDPNRVYLKVKDLIDYHSINLCSKKIIEICPSAIFSTLLLNLDM